MQLLILCNILLSEMIVCPSLQMMKIVRNPQVLKSATRKIDNPTAIHAAPPPAFLYARQTVRLYVLLTAGHCIRLPAIPLIFNRTYLDLNFMFHLFRTDKSTLFLSKN